MPQAEERKPLPFDPYEMMRFASTQPQSLHFGNDNSFKAFPGKPYEIEIPARDQPEAIKKEVEKLDVNILSQETYPQHIRHLHILTAYENPTVIQTYIPTIIKRLEENTEQFIKEFYSDPKQISQEREVLEQNLDIATLECLYTYAQSDLARFTPQQIKTLYERGKKRAEFIGLALSFDEKNKKTGDSLNLDARIKEDLATKLLDSPDKKLDESLEIAHIVSPDILPSTLIYALLKANSQQQIEQILQHIVPFLGLEGLRKSLREYTRENSDFQDKFNTAVNYLGIDQGERAATDLGEVYSQADMSDYGPYKETLPYEIELLKKIFKGKKEVLDVGCGRGRHLLALEEDLNVSGIDMQEEDIRYIRINNPRKNVQLGSWFDIPSPNNSFDGAYVLGRSFTHNVTIPDAIACLTEIRRSIRDDGTVILDLPDPNVGEYKEYVEKTTRIAKAKGISNFIPGTINDSPDNKHYFDRLALDPDQFMAMAELAGFKAEIIGSAGFKGINGKKNSNLYWKLTKCDLPDPTTKTYLTDAILKKGDYLQIIKTNLYKNLFAAHRS